MSMKKNSDFVKHYAVQIKSDFGKQGSGVLIKIDDNKCYLATAKHNFTISISDDSWKDVKEIYLIFLYYKIRRKFVMCLILDIFVMGMM